MTIRYIHGDLFQNIQSGDVLCHIVNDVYKIGAGFTKPLIKHFPNVRDGYLNWKITGNVSCTLTSATLKLGHVQFLQGSSPQIIIANMCAQHGVRSRWNQHPIDYAHLASCLQHVANYVATKTTVNRIVAPKFGTGLACGDWEIIATLIEKYWDNFEVVICSL